MQIEDIARVCHEVNRSYCQALGDSSQVPWEEAPQWQKYSAIARVKLHLQDPLAGPAKSHESWLAHKLDNGWKYGLAKDAEKRTHPCIAPFDQLPKEQQAKDYIFCAVVHALSAYLTP